MKKASIEPAKAPFTFYEFFAGVGMARLGLGPNWRVAWANDFDARKTRLYSRNFGGRDLDTRDIAEVAREVGEADHTSTPSAPAFPVGVDMAWASFPCQDLSLAGWRRGMSGSRSGTYWQFHSIMASLLRRGQRPPVLVLENVTGLLYGSEFRGLAESLSALGMRFGALVLDAKHFVPQSRPRVFIVAVDRDADLGAFGAASPGTWHTKPVIAAYGALPDELKTQWVWWSLPASDARRVEIAAVFERTPTDVSYHSLAETDRLLTLMSDIHRDKVRSAVQSGVEHIGFLYKRTRNGTQQAEVRFDGIAGCLRTPSGGSSRQTVVIVQSGTVRSRLLSRLEAARLMGLPLDRRGHLTGHSKPFFPEDLSYNDAYHAMGDGVVVPVVSFLSKHLLTPLAGLFRSCRPTRRDQDLGKGEVATKSIGESCLERCTEDPVGAQGW